MPFAARPAVAQPVAWFDRFTIGYLEHDFLDFELIEWPLVKDELRIPRDFDDERYRELYPDVAEGPRKHYLLHGAAEQRPYK